ncbi:phospholipase D-like domain-containing protein [Henriciella mobilis]|uniref:Phospholipase D n=1 Tax=Henriciella mobilis TaxID=2305467 RepID=A0A399R947_9PROT|nr:phospholipase D-like domain-containing protein [Henriciella mobilis]RIJ26565.1 hypothetical protein D1223_16475 [Henriciella mobilis]
MKRPVYVAMPMLQQSYEFELESGRRWNAVEHLILQAICQKAQSAGDMSRAGNMPRRVALEALIRLMRAGWVELSQAASEVHFSATDRGRTVAMYEDLPFTTETKTRRLSFAVDLVSGKVLNKRELKLMRPDEWREFAEAKVAVEVSKPDISNTDFGHTAPLIRALVREDEDVVRIKPSVHPPLDRLAVFLVRGDNVEGLPRDAAGLNGSILEAASRVPSEAKADGAAKQVKIIAPDKEQVRPVRHTAVRHADYVLGGADHRSLIQRTLRKARKLVVIHTTFLREGAFLALQEDFRAAVNRGAKIHVFWGQGDSATEAASSRAEAERLRIQLGNWGLNSNITIHNASTNSHAKILLADDGSGDFTATIGSCNWLYSGFDSFEASVILRDPRLVSDVLFELAEMVRTSNRDFTDIGVNFLQLARTLAIRSPRNGTSEVKILIGEEHDDCVLDARDNAQRQVDVISHRLGVTAVPAIILPMVSATRARGIQTNLFYSKASGPVSSEDSQEVRNGYQGEGVSITPVYSPRVHAKMLLRDDDHGIITSLNWLSADTSNARPHQEMGVMIRSPGSARHLREQFQVKREYAS